VGVPPLDHEEQEEAASNLLRAKIDKSVKNTPPFRPSDLKLIDNPFHPPDSVCNFVCYARVPVMPDIL
jgi:hypothetical protein